MKNFKLILFLLVLLSSLLVKANNVSDVMQKANEYYKNNQYQSAINEYNKLIKEGYTGTSLLYNIGNSYYRLGKIGYAILYYEKALKYSPSDEDVLHNLKLARLNLKDKVDSLPPFFIFNLWEGLLASFSMAGWTMICYIFFILLLVCIVAYFFSKTVQQQRLSFFSGIAFTFLLSFSIALLMVKMNKEFNIKYGIVLESAVNVKSSPDYSSKEEFIIHEGLKVKLEDRVDDWVKIRLEDGKVGWIENKSAGVI
jgi:tetratricopeptide (TPR) repeat protein